MTKVNYPFSAVLTNSAGLVAGAAIPFMNHGPTRISLNKEEKHDNISVYTRNE